MRRGAMLVFVALAAAGPARAATLTVSPQDVAPARTPVAIVATTGLPRQVGVLLAHPNGRRIGWIARPSRRVSRLDLAWNGRLGGRTLQDGRYLVRLVLGGTVLAEQSLRIDTFPPQLHDLSVDNGSTPFQGDSKLLATVSPNGDGFRDEAHVRFGLREPAVVTMDVTRTVKVPHTIYTLTERLGRGPHTLLWKPGPTLNPRTYLIRLHAVDGAGNQVVYGAASAFVGREPRAPIVRLQGIDAGFTRTSYAPGEIATLRVATDESSLTERVFHSGPEQVVTYADNQLNGVEVDTGPLELDWHAWQSRPHSFRFQIPTLPSGLYYVQLTGPDGRVGYAPFVVRPVVFGATSRVLVVLPTNTWEAYNFQDVDGDGWGDTWYAGAPHQTMDLDRTYIARGVPPRFYRYDLPFLHWLYWSGKSAELIGDSDFDTVASGDDLARTYDLVVFEGHEEYVTTHEYDVIQRFRDLGGNLMFLSANNFFWRVQQTGTVLRRALEWRQAGRPEAALIGVQYRANDDGQRQGDFVAQATAAAPWLWDGTGVADGSTFGSYVGGYGIEIDATAPSSPPGTLVLAQIPDLFGPGITAQMSYYETPAGAKVFAAGALDFGGSATFWPVKRMLDNLWTRMTQP